MARTELQAGDRTRVTITTSAPFGVFVETADGLPGLVPGARGDVGQLIAVEVTGVDAEQHRFSAKLVG